MKAASTKGFGRNIHLRVIESERPKVGATDVLVEVYASSVNPKDWKLNTGISSMVPKIGPFAGFHILGDDLAGIVVDKGEGVSQFQIGDAVYGMDMRLRTAACAQYALINEQRIAPKPETLSFGEAASVPLAALTALQAFNLGKVGPGSRLLIIGASGGVGTFAVQIAKAMGAQVTAICSGRNTALVTSLGADTVIDYTQADFTKEESNYDVVFDATAYESLSSCASLLQDNGIFISTAGHGKALFNTYRPNFSHKPKSAKAIWVESYTSDLNVLTKFVEDGLVKPVIDSEFDLADIEAAYTRSKTGRSQGKVVIKICA